MAAIDEYNTYEECLLNLTHLTDCDDDGYCNYCGDDTPVKERYATTFTFEATDAQDAADLLSALIDAMATSDALPVYGNTGYSTPRQDKTWPDTDTERATFRAWKREVANGDTLRGFRDWAAELDTDTSLDD